ncbi:hypothetical protein GCM10009819_00320 [Agromyces tropicus]|uniref:DUF4175 domain-containing protein n=1 Tax=Agromyces tropicus TaxID=555371 RepID=A0ABP5FC11_9MICO
MADETPTPTPQRFFHACLLILGGIVALSLALELLAQFWGWLVLIAGIALVIWAAVVGVRHWREHRW